MAGLRFNLTFRDNCLASGGKRGLRGPTIRSASLAYYQEIARSVGLDPYAMLERAAKPRSQNFSGSCSPSVCTPTPLCPRLEDDDRVVTISRIRAGEGFNDAAATADAETKERAHDDRRKETTLNCWRASKAVAFCAL